MAEVGTRDKNVDWYQAELEDVNPQARSVLETYCKIPSDEVVPHVLRIREKAWEVFPYPCIGGFRFLDMPLAGFDTYPEIVSRLKSGNDKYLDLGCCFGQDIRRLVADEVSDEALIGSDLHQGFLDLGYDLFKDKDRLRAKFIAADVFEAQSELTPLEGNIDIIHASSFFHLFGWEGQKQIARRVVQLLKPKKDSLLVGRQVGNIRAHEEESSASGSGNMFLQNIESWKQMWKEIGEETGTQWKVEATLEEWPLAHNIKSWHREGTKRIFFSVRRL
ncbi:hypothetical protein KCU81_g2702, partial [Aureobasidium melanogenum]|uniref:Methyltransferase domain-containing protein n=1 Tax=Aureobasidium melanogenum (strain CBS 110374) TaxID=1043003 RepID=A0A074VHS1_AURM1